MHDFGPLMKGLVIGSLGILHVFLAQFAIGGGFLICLLQRRAMQGKSPLAREFIQKFFSVLVLVSFVLGAVTGVAMWFTTIQISPRTIGVMVHEFHWIWAIEWTFFSLEVTSGYLFYKYSSRLDDRSALTLAGLYALAAWSSLFWINGILSWQLTPGGWLDGHNVWSGFFNASFWPSLLFRTITALTIAGLSACILVNAIPGYSREDRESLVHDCSSLLAPMAAMPLLGLWYFAVIPADSREWVMGGSMPMTMFLNLAVVFSGLIGGYALVGLIRQKLFINGATATLLLALAFMATGAGEFVREGVRKPFSIREYLYANSVRVDEVAYLRREGSVTHDPYPVAEPKGGFPTDQLRHGAGVFRFQCSVCHTVDGTNGLLPLVQTWSNTQLRLNISQLQRTKPFMPPFAGNAKDVEALVQWINWNRSDAPPKWGISQDAAILEEIQGYLDEAGVVPGSNDPTDAQVAEVRS